MSWNEFNIVCKINKLLCLYCLNLNFSELLGKSKKRFIKRPNLRIVLCHTHLDMFLGHTALGDQGEKKNRRRREKIMQQKSTVYKRRQKQEEKKLHLDVV